MNQLQPILIIGAPRSGTNALRDALCSLPAFHTWPCDELNPLWRTGNSNHPDDELTRAHARPEVRSRISRAFERRDRCDPTALLVEKTCANTLRLPFVDAVFPHARYIEIVRDGRDAASSAAERWGSSFELGYTLKKLRFVPPSDLVKVGATQLRNKFGPSRIESATVKSWGPRWNGVDEFLAGKPTIEQVCAEQWAQCVSRSRDFSAQIAPARWLTVRYEDFVSTPSAVLSEIADELRVTGQDEAIETASRGIHARSVGRWRSTPLVEDTTALRVIESVDVDPRLTFLGD